MRILSINCGSSTLKFKLFRLEGSGLEEGIKIAAGSVERIGDSNSRLNFAAGSGQSLQQFTETLDHKGATRRVLDWLQSESMVGPEGLDAIGHRIVHGGERFAETALLDEKIMSSIEELTDLAPLHNGPALEAIRAARDALGPSVPMAAVFDTAFHRTMPEYASRYAIPMELADRHGIRRYGFHGTAHRYMMERHASLTGIPVEETNLITLQLGNGCSVTAIRDGRSIETSMGFTPLEGLVMGTRSGNVDPSLASFLSRREGVDTAEIEDWLNRRSGLLGISGVSKDMRELVQARDKGNINAELAIEMFCYRARQYLGAYFAALGGRVDALVLGGGISENAPELRERILEDMEWCGLRLNSQRNAETVGSEAKISVEDSKVQAYVVPVDEEMTIAQDTVSCLSRRA